MSQITRQALSCGASQSHTGRFVASMLRTVSWAVACLLLLAVSLPSAKAQLYTGSVAGTITDPSGSVIPGATITLTDTEKGFTYTGKSDSSGRYLVRQVPPGSYDVSVEAANFQSQRKEGIKIDINQNVSIDFSLKIGASTEVVDVVASSVHLQTEDAVTGQVVNRKFVNDLPLVDRNFTNLAYLAPGVTETNVVDAKNANGGINFNANGSRNSTADVLIDGASATNFEQNSGIQNVPYTPSVDSIEEFKVQESNFTAEFGFAGGTIINVVTRSGTNQFHGSAYEFHRDSALDANDWFANRNGDVVSPFRRNNFGVTFGGPIIKDKTFFFFDYEGLRESSFAGSQSGVPSLCERGQGPCPYGATGLGNFSELCTLQGGTFDGSGMCSDPTAQLWDPYTGVFSSDPAEVGDAGPGAVRSNFIPFNDLSTYVSPGNPNLAGTQFQPAAGVPGNLIDPAAAKLFALFPTPTSDAESLDDLQNLNFSTTGTRGSSNNQWDLKIDHRFSDRDMLSVKFSRGTGHSTSFNCYQNFADPCSSGPSEDTRHLLSINHTHTFSPTAVLTFTYGYVRGFDFSHGVGTEFSDFSSLYAGTNLPSYLDRGFDTLPVIEIGGGYNSPLGSQAFAILREGQDSHHLGATVSWIKGNHELKFGGEVRMHRINFVQPGWPSGDFSFNRSSTSRVSSATDGTEGGDGLASFLTGVGDVGNTGGSCTPCQVGFVNYVSTQSFQYAGFAQDNYKVTPKLTLNLGLRYEVSTPRTERFNRMDYLDPNAVSPLSVPGVFDTLHGAEVFVGPGDRSNYNISYNGIQPRFGLAYQLPHEFVLRGGYGIYFSTPRSGASGTGPWGFAGFDVQPPWLTSLNNDHATPWNTLKNTSCSFTDSTSCGVAPPPGNSLGAFNDIGFDAVGPMRKVSQSIPYEQIWTFGFQKEIPGKILLDASYIGKKGTHLYLGGFRNTNFLPQSAVQGVNPSDIALLNDQVTNPFYFDPSAFPVGTACDPTRYICDTTSPLAGPEVPAFQLLLPYPQYTGFLGDSPPVANSIYHAFQFRAEKEFSNGLQFLVTYTLSKSLDNASATDDSISWLGGGTTDGDTLGVQNPYDLRAERALSVYDIPQVLQFSYVYELPVGKGRRFGGSMHPALDAVIGGWQLNGIVRIDNGRPIIPLLDSSNAIPTFGQRPNLTGTLKRGSGTPQDATDPDNGTSYFANPDVLSQTDDFTLGTAPRTIGTVRQPGSRDVSMSLFKEFSLGFVREGMRLQFRAESFNTFNHPHFDGPNTSVGSSDFGFISRTINSPRELQLALKLYF